MSPGLEIESSSSGDLDSRLHLGVLIGESSARIFANLVCTGRGTLCGCHLLKIGPGWVHYDSHTANFCVYSIFLMFLLNQIVSHCLAQHGSTKKGKKN